MGINCSRRAEVTLNVGPPTVLVSGDNITARGQPDTGATVIDSGARTTSRFNKIGGAGLARFRCAVRRVIRLLALRRKWAAYGRVLQAAPRCHLFDGLERRKGVLRRVRKLQ